MSALSDAGAFVRGLTRAAAFLACVLPAAAQTDTTGGWNPAANGRLSFAQTGFSNWPEGGVSSLAFSGRIDLAATAVTGRWSRNIDVRLALGLIRQDSVGVRKADDLLQVVSTFTYRGDGFFRRFRPTLEASLRSQFADGFDYGGGAPERVSAFLAPATIEQSIGLTYAPVKYVSQRVGVGGKQTVVTIAGLRPRYAVDPGRSVRLEAGVDMVTEFDANVADNVQLRSTLSLFASFNQPHHPDARFEVLVSMKVNEWLTVNFEVVTIYDTDIERLPQIKEVLSAGISYRLL